MSFNKPFRAPPLRRAPRRSGRLLDGFAVRLLGGAMAFGLTLGTAAGVNGGGEFAAEGSTSRKIGARLGLAREHLPPAGAHYSGCNDARAAGVTPIYAGEPGYRPEMDGDSDGIACEPYRGRY